MHKYGVTVTSQLVGGSPTRVVLVTKPDGSRGRVGTEVDQLLAANGPYATMTVHPEYAGQIVAYACRAQQPRRRLGTVAHRPAQPTDQDSIEAPAAVVTHGRAVTESS
ncbi:MAG TPA: hypothetical protein VFY56_10785 [Propionibacteriaceae bacterium]|nr:hypothetical protein [Propionibacteriaceae bacterium]